MSKTSTYHMQCSILKNELQSFFDSTPNPQTFHIAEIREDVELLITKIENYFNDVINKKIEPITEVENETTKI